MKKIKSFNENWRDSVKLKDMNAKTGIFDEEGVEGDLQEFEEVADKSFEELFDKSFDLGTLFGGDFKEYMDSREQAFSDKSIVTAYRELVDSYKHFKDLIINDLRDAQDNYGHG